MVEAVLIGGAILIIHVQILEIAEIKVGKKTHHCLNFSSVFPTIWILINISVVII